MERGEPCRLLEWDSEFFGFRVGQVTLPRLGEQELSRVRDWMRRQSVTCLYYLADSDDPAGIRAAEATGFRFTDVRVTLERGLHGAAPAQEAGVSAAVPADVERLREIARVSHRHSRFYSDPGFPDERCDALYATWIANSCAGYADRVLVVREGDRACGYITCHLDPGGRGRIGLVAVADGARGRGFGPRLVRGSLAWFAGAGMRRVCVSTQGRNAPALQLYEKEGFLTESVRPWLHLWCPAR